MSFLDHVRIPLILAGSRSSPDSTAMTLAKSVPGHYPSWKAAIERELIEHLVPYAEAIASGELPAPEIPLPAIGKPSDVWSHVTIEFIAVAPLDGKLTVELGYRVAWDEEHTLGVRFRDGQFLELCGSVLYP